MNYIKTHLFYIILIAMGVVCFRVWLQEHDARVSSDNALKISNSKVQDLQQQIVTVTAQAAQRVQVVTKIVHDATTPSQVVAAVPQLTDVQLNARVAPTLAGAAEAVTVDAQPFVQLLGQCKTDTINLGACQENYKSCQAIVNEREADIAILKKKPSFLHRIGGIAKAVGVGVGIGLLLGGHL